MKSVCRVFLALVLSVQLALGQDYSVPGSYPSATRLFGVTYSPFALNTHDMCLPKSQVEADMKIISTVADHLRLYNLQVCPDLTTLILDRAREMNIRIILGPYLSGSEQDNNAEVKAVKSVVENFGDIIDAVVVGNEVLFGKIVGLRDLLYYIKEVREIVKNSGHKIPISTAEVWPVLESGIGPSLVAELDFVCMNMQPIWEGWDIVCPKSVSYRCSSAAEYVHLKAEGLEDYLKKPVWICESGWPTEGERCCQGREHARDGLLAGPSEANATIFIGELVKTGKAANRPTYVHAMFDEYWKKIWAPCGTCEGLSTLLEDPKCSTCELDYHFGVFNFDRTPKAGVKLPEPVLLVT